MLSTRKSNEMEEAVAEQTAAGIEACCSAADSAREEELRYLANQEVQRLGAVDLVVNNAGATWGSEVPMQSMRVRAPVHVAAAVGGMRQGQRASHGCEVWPSSWKPPAPLRRQQRLGILQDGLDRV